MSETLRAVARAIFAQALAAVDVRKAVLREIAVRNSRLTLGDQSLPLNAISRVLIIALGKAAVPMHAAALLQLAHLPCQSIVVAPVETFPATYGETANEILYLPGSHPMPTPASLAAAHAILQLLAGVDERTAVLFLISGGASAMVEQPLDTTITPDEITRFNRALIGSGLPIASMNVLRKRLSAVKGGRLAVAAAKAAMQCTLLISDVPEADPGVVASGPSLPDTATVAQAHYLFKELDKIAILPASLRNVFLADALPETPKADHEAFAHAHWKVILSSQHLAAAARAAAQQAGFHALIDNGCDEWEYRAAGKYLLDASAVLAKRHPHSCLISVGEVGVELPQQHGEGGRNAQLALWCAEELARCGQQHTAVLSAGSDGVDGCSSTAGAVCDATTPGRAAAEGFHTARALDAFDSYPLLRAVHDAITTGPTGNNLRDLRLVLTEREAE